MALPRRVEIAPRTKGITSAERSSLTTSAAGSTPLTWMSTGASRTFVQHRFAVIGGRRTRTTPACQFLPRGNEWRLRFAVIPCAPFAADLAFCHQRGGDIASLNALTSYAEKKKERLIEALCRW